MENEILLPEIINYDKAHELATNSYYESVYSFRNILFILLKYKYKVNLPNELNPAMGAVKKEAGLVYKFTLAISIPFSPLSIID